jgi:hypothetical protein
MDGLLIATPNGGMNAPTLSSATRDVTGTLSRMRQTRWFALAGIALLVAGVIFWAARITTSVPLSHEAEPASEEHVAAAALAPPPAVPKPKAPPEVSPVPPPAESPAEPGPAKVASSPALSKARSDSPPSLRKPSSARSKKLAPAGRPVDDPLADQK